MEPKKMMRKAFWCGMCLVVTAATGVYWAADFCRRHPDATWVRSAVHLAQWGQGFDPILHVEPTPARHQPGIDSAEGTSSCQNLAAPAPIDLTALALPDRSAADATDAASSEPIARPSFPFVIFDEVVPASFGPFATDREGDAYQIMPPCLDDEGLPDLMPYAADADRSTELSRCCPGGFLTPSTGSPAPMEPGTRGDVEEQEPKVERSPSSPAPGGVLKPASAGTSPMSYPVVPRNPPVQPIIDTTEFRPTDARKGEFDRAPL